MERLGDVWVGKGAVPLKGGAGRVEEGFLNFMHVVFPLFVFFHCFCVLSPKKTSEKVGCVVNQSLNLNRIANCMLLKQVNTFRRESILL